MLLVKCCEEMQKFEGFWEYVEHLKEQHGYTETAAHQVAIDGFIWEAA